MSRYRMNAWRVPTEGEWMDAVGDWYAVEPNTGCWIWMRAHGRDGYGFFKINKKQRRPHRIAYEAFRGAIPEGLTIDHLCRCRACVNPDHLEAVTLVENIRRGGNGRKTHCKHGHPFDEANTNFVPAGRQCRECQKMTSLAKKFLRGIV